MACLNHRPTAGSALGVSAGDDVVDRCSSGQPSREPDPGRRPTPSAQGRACVTIALIEHGSWSTGVVAAQLLQWRYRILWFRPADLRFCESLIEDAVVILTNRTRWQIERLLGRTNHPPVITTDDFDLSLRGRIEAYLKNLGVIPPV